MRAATAGTARVVLTAGLIVAAGTAALVVGELDFFRAFGPGLAITALIAVAVCLTFIPACLALFGGRLAPREARAGAGAPRPPPRGATRRRAAARARCGLRLAGPFTAMRAARHAADERGRAAAAGARRADRQLAPGGRRRRARLLRRRCCSRRAASASWTSG